MWGIKSRLDESGLIVVLVEIPSNYDAHWSTRSTSFARAGRAHSRCRNLQKRVCLNEWTTLRLLPVRIESGAPPAVRPKHEGVDKLAGDAGGDIGAMCPQVPFEYVLAEILLLGLSMCLRALSIQCHNRVAPAPNCALTRWRFRGFSRHACQMRTAA